MAGLIDLNIGGTTNKSLPTGNTVAEMKPVGYTPETRTVDAATETVSGQLDRLLSKESPYISRARSNSLAAANSRGLVNSSIAAGAGERAAIESALPIAQGDASVYDTAARENLGHKNQALQFGAGASNTAGQFNAASSNEFSKAQQAAELEKGLIQSRGAEERNTLAAQGEQQRQTLEQSGAQDIELQTLRGQQAETLGQMEAQYKTLIQASSSASELFKSITGAMAAIMADTNTSAEQKQTAVNKMGETLRAGMAVVGGIANLDLTSLLDFTGA